MLCVLVCNFALHLIQFILSGNIFKLETLNLYISMNCQDVKVMRIALTLSVTASLLCFVVYAGIANINLSPDLFFPTD